MVHTANHYPSAHGENLPAIVLCCDGHSSGTGIFSALRAHFFLSSKETNSLRRSRMSPELMEALQILKFSFRQDRLCFTRDFIAKEEDYAISGPVTQRTTEELIHAGKLD